MPIQPQTFKRPGLNMGQPRWTQLGSLLTLHRSRSRRRTSHLCPLDNRQIPRFPELVMPHKIVWIACIVTLSVSDRPSILFLWDLNTLHKSFQDAASWCIGKLLDVCSWSSLSATGYIHCLFRVFPDTHTLRCVVPIPCQSLWVINNISSSTCLLSISQLF